MCMYVYIYIYVYTCKDEYKNTESVIKETRVKWYVE